MVQGRNPFMPFIDKLDFDAEAEKFLSKYCSEALRTPMPIPIWDIAKKKMSLDIIQTESLSPDGSVQGAIAFTKGIIDIYDWSSQEYIGYEVKKGTVFLDADILNDGRQNNTLAHECFHWYKHRSYFVYQCSHNEGVDFAFRCDKRTLEHERDGSKWSDEEKMEWQARTIAPKILMPKNMTIQKIEELYKEALYGSMSDNRFPVTRAVIDKLATFFRVSKQSAAIRMQELGYQEASEFYQYDDRIDYINRRRSNHSTGAKYHQQKISLDDAFKLYCSNDYLKTTIDTGVFCYADGYFVLKDEKYVAHNDNQSFSLTEYAKDHLAECTLDFSRKLVSESKYIKTSMNMMFRIDTDYKEVSSYDNTVQNAEMYNKAKELEKRQAEFEADFALSSAINKTAAQKLREIIDLKHWNSSIFQDKTHLDKMFFSRLKKDDYPITLEPIIAICAGLDLPLPHATDILSSARYVLKPTDKTHCAYQYILSAMRGESIDSKNAFLEKNNIKPLGSKSRDEQS